MSIPEAQTELQRRGVTVQELLATPDLRPLTLLGGDTDRVVRSVRAVDDLTALRNLDSDSLAIVLPTAAAHAHGHQFDVALRDTAATGAAGLVLTGTDGRSIEPTARRIASRSRLALLASPSTVDSTLLVIAVSRALTGDPADALARIDAARRHIANAEATKRTDPAKILAAATGALGTDIRARDPNPTEPAAPIVIDGIPDGFITATPPSHPRAAWAVAAHTIVRLTADAYARAVADNRRGELAPIRDRGRLLGELLLAPESERAPLVSRARTLGIPVDGWHQVLRFELTSSLTDPAPTTSTEQIDALACAILDAVRADGDDTWHSTRIGGDPLLVRNLDTDPGPSAARTAHRAATISLAAARTRFPGLIVRCGIGGVHRRAEGLRTSATDTRAALAATRQSRPPRDIIAIDALGLNRMLVDWYASDTTRASVDDMLAPLTELDPHTAEELIRTLQAYLDHRNSPAKAAKDLSVHPQTVNYRLRKITGRLHVDLEDTEQRLALQLACRAWLMR